MSDLLNQASLVYIPSGYKEDTAYSVIPTNGSGDLTFTRASDGTRVNSQGLVERVPYNLLTYSQDLTNVIWTLAGLTYNGTETDPNGGSNAYSYTSNGSNAYLRQNNSLSVGQYTFSVYLKSTTSISINIRLDSNNGTFTNYPCSLTTDWQKFSFSYTHNGTTLGAWIGGGLSWTTGEEVHIAFPQLNEGTLKPYFPTTDRQNVPRLDYSNGCPSLLLEPQRTNLNTYSQQLDQWSSAGSGTVTTNTEISPDGTQNADTLTDTDNAGYYRIEQYITTTVGQKYTASVFIKKASASLTYWPGVQWDLSYRYCIFNNFTGTYALVGGTSDYDSISVEDFGTYWRVSLTITAGDTTERFAFWPSLSDNGTSISTSATGSNVFWGAQVEAGSYPTSYIPTTSASVTRVADAASKTGISSLIGQTEGTLFGEFNMSLTGITSGARKGLLFLSDGTYNNRIEITKLGGLASSVADDIHIRITTGGVNQFDIKVKEDVTGLQKIALAYKSGETVCYINGVQLYTNSSAISIPTTSFYQIGDAYNTPAGELVNQAVLFKTRLTNAELASLTTL